jgi:hypothetical protein
MNSDAGLHRFDRIGDNLATGAQKKAAPGANPAARPEVIGEETPSRKLLGALQQFLAALQISCCTAK